MQFHNRWLISGTLKTISPLHVGDGQTIERTGWKVEAGPKKGQSVQIPSVATDIFSKPYLPGMSIKGNLRQWLETAGSSPIGLIDTVFGTESDKPSAMGGKAEFWDAMYLREDSNCRNVPHWDNSRSTGVMAFCATDRSRRVTAHSKLFHIEFVPPGVTFGLTVSGQNLDEDEISLLLLALEGFNRPSGCVTLGASTSSGWGRFSWHLERISRFTNCELPAWLQQKPLQSWDKFAVPLPKAEIEALLPRASSPAITHGPFIEIGLDLQFEGPFLVNDPAAAKNTPANDRTDTADQVPLCDISGFPYLPAESVRGAMRSQAEKIIRTLNPAAACLERGPLSPCGTVYNQKSVENLCLSCHIFGAPGWKGLLEWSDFTWNPEKNRPKKFLTQQFVSIDRFTGGSLEDALFNIQYAYKPVLSGILRISMTRAADVPGKASWYLKPWAIGLLSLLLRDLAQGDIGFGFGNSKGFGACRASITSVKVSELNTIGTYRQMLDNFDVDESLLNSPYTLRNPPEQVQHLLGNTIQAFHEHVKQFRLDVAGAERQQEADHD
jgi:CRISPR/Cas system CSM-associated protein Csm3 (group 7 of RAMP superfamily)